MSIGDGELGATQRVCDNTARHTLDPWTRPTLSRRGFLRWTLRTWSERRRGTERRGTSSESEGFWLDGDLLEFVAEAPSDQETGDVWADLDASANLADGGGALEDGDGVAGFCESVGGRETAEATANDDDADGQGRAPSLEEVGSHGDGEASGRSKALL